MGQLIGAGPAGWIASAGAKSLMSAAIGEDVENVTEQEQDVVGTSQRLRQLMVQLAEIRERLALPADLPHEELLAWLEEARKASANTDEAFRDLTRGANEAAGQLRQIRELWGLSARATHQDVYDHQREVKLAVDSARVAHQRLESLLGLPNAGWETLLDAVAELVESTKVQTLTAEEAERQRLARQEALHTVMDLWQQHPLGEDPPAMDDLVLAAEWLSTGDITAVVQVRELYVDRARSDAVSSDAMTWTPGDSDE